jgi:dipeptidyl aminopeptidase/acylaminoacyl peptidase
MKNRINILRRLRVALASAAGLSVLGGAEPWPESSDQLGDVFLAPSQESPQASAGPNRGPRLVFRDRIAAHWFGDNTRFWYRNDLAGGAREFIFVDAAKGLRQSAFDHTKLATALSKAAGKELVADQLPFSAIEFTPDGKAIRFKLDETVWQCELDSYACAKLEGVTLKSPEEDPPISPRPTARTGDNNASSRSGARGESPDGKWSAFVRDHNLFVRAKDGSAEKPLSQDGTKEQPYGRVSWSPDSRTVAAFRVEPGERKEVFLVRSSPPGGGRATMTSRPYALPGDKFSRHELNLFDAATCRQTKPAVDRFEHEWSQPDVRWNKDGTKLAYQQADRGHQRFRVVQVDRESGEVRNLIDEKSETFIWTAHTESLRLRLVNWLEKTDELIYVSERDGWRHLYLVDRTGGTLKPITHGEWVLRGIDRIDEDKREIWFHASGRNPGQDPYFLHYYRVNFDGSGLVALTDGNGNHAVDYSPDRSWSIDTYSRVDAAPLVELRRASDGKLACKLEEADTAALRAGNWMAPEVFVSKARDGKTDIWGVIFRPRNFDPAKKHPVIESIYAGPQGSFTPKSFSAASRFSGLTDAGFVVVQMDGMGTANRSKAFHDVCFKNLKDAGFPDRILWHKAAAAKYPWYDVSRVGIYGTSAGGQNAAGAVLFHPEFYRAAVANSGCHDNRMDKASWNEQWMGYPVGPQYAESSNIDNAGKLRGHLFLVVGELDANVPPESTYRFADALIKANKDFDFLVVINGGHGSGGAYYQRRLQDFFTRHLMEITPPNRNAAPAQ